MSARSLPGGTVAICGGSQKRLPEKLLTRFDGDRFYHVMAGEDEREGGVLLYFNLPRPLPIIGANREYPSPMKFLGEARREKNVWVDVEKPFWWDVPIWLAGGRSIRSGWRTTTCAAARCGNWRLRGRPRDARRLPPPLGNAFWSQEIYYHILNCGLRLPPSAGALRAFCQTRLVTTGFTSIREMTSPTIDGGTASGQVAALSPTALCFASKPAANCPAMSSRNRSRSRLTSNSAHFP